MAPPHIIRRIYGMMRGTMADGYKLYTANRSGGTIVELILAKLKSKNPSINIEIIRVDWEEIGNPEYKKINPLGQVPAMRLPSGEIMTESLAINTYINNKHGMGLIPSVEDSNYAKYLRWSTYLVGSIYPTFTYSDYPERYVSHKECGPELKEKIDRFRETMWLEFERAVSDEGPWFLGKNESIIDSYLSNMVFWRPRNEWFSKNCPKISKIAERIQQTEIFKNVWSLNKI